MGLVRCSGQSSGFLLVHMGCGFTDLERLAASPSFFWVEGKRLGNTSSETLEDDGSPLATASP